jgi:hypothetical protein
VVLPKVNYVSVFFDQFLQIVFEFSSPYADWKLSNVNSVIGKVDFEFTLDFVGLS